MIGKLINTYKNACKPAQYSVVLSIILLSMINVVMVRFSSLKIDNYLMILRMLLINIGITIVNFFFQYWLCKVGVRWLAWISVFLMAWQVLIIFYVLFKYISANEEDKERILQEILVKIQKK